MTDGDTSEPAPLTVVTGASSGLGTEFARLAAADGHAVLLVARRVERLDALAEALRADHGVTVSTRSTDLADAAQLQALARDLADRPVATLVNNAGFGLRGRFDRMDADALLQMVTVNMTAVTVLARAVAPGMAARCNGGILNVASMAALQPGPGMAAYYASKSYVLSLSEALWAELRPHGVRVTALCPGPTATEFDRRAGLTGTLMFDRRTGQVDDAGPVARAGWTGLKRGRRVVLPGLTKRAYGGVAAVVPRRLMLALVRRVNGLRS